MAGIDWDKIERARLALKVKPQKPDGWFFVMDYAKKYNVGRSQATRLLYLMLKAGTIKRAKCGVAYVYKPV